MAQGILLDRSQLLEVTYNQDYCQINYGFHTFQKYYKDDLAAQRVSIVQLLSMGIKKSKLSETFSLHRKTIEKWEKVYQKGGMLALVKMENGRSPKCDETIDKYIVELDKKLGKQNGYKKMIAAEVENLFGVRISREVIRKVLKKYSSLKDEKILKQQNSKINNIKEEDRETVEVKNGGVLLALPFLEKFNLFKMIPGSKTAEAKGYNFKEIIMTISMLLTGGLLKNEEQIKINDSPCMGSILQRKQLPSLRTIRRSVPELIERIDIKKIKKIFASTIFKLYVDRNIFYIDGHFMPYHGKEKILYGYNSLKRIAMKGRTSYVVNTESGRPLYQILSDNFDNFNDNIAKTIRFLRGIIHDKNILLVFDRGGFGEDFFNTIQKDTLFVCWSKGKSSPSRAGKWQKVNRYLESNVWGDKKTELLYVKEETVEMPADNGSYILRRFFVKKEEKISAAVTNDLGRPIDELVRILTNRWAAQENVFKDLKKIGYDNIHSYWKDEYSEEIILENEIDIKKEMTNPEYKTAVDERKILKKALKKLNAKIGKQLLNIKDSSKPVKAILNLKNEIEKMEKKIKEVADRIEYLPEKIFRYDHIKENDILKLGSEKKEFFDLLKFISYNVRWDIAEIIGHLYKDNRDIHTIIVKWLKAKCILKKINGELILNMHCPANKNEEAALRKLCDYLNELNYRHFNSDGIMRFKVAA